MDGVGATGLSRDDRNHQPAGPHGPLTFHRMSDVGRLPAVLVQGRDTAVQQHAHDRARPFGRDRIDLQRGERGHRLSERGLVLSGAERDAGRVDHHPFDRRVGEPSRSRIVPG